MIKLIAVDMDGTLLNDNHLYNKEKFLALFKTMQQKNIKFVAASGSQYQRLRHKFSEVADQIGYISQNGAIVHNASDMMQIAEITEDQVHQILDLIAKIFPKDFVLNELVSGLVGTYVNQSIDPLGFKFVKQYFRPVFKVPSLAKISAATVGDNFTKVSVSFAQGVNLDEVTEKIRQNLPEQLKVENSGFNTDLIGSGIANKRSGIKVFQKLFNISDDEVVAFGDNENDLSMLTMNANSYAMKNSAEKIKKAAGHVTKWDNNHDGVLKTIEEII